MTAKQRVSSFHLIALLLSITAMNAHEGSGQPARPLIIKPARNGEAPVSIAINKLLPSKASILMRKRLYRWYQPIEVCIENKSNNSYLLKSQHFSLFVASIKDVRGHLQTPAFLGFVWPGIFLTPLIGLNPVAYLIGYASTATISTTGVITYKNKCVEKNIDAHVVDLRESLVIPPLCTIQKIMYIPKRSFKTPINMQLLNSENDNLLTVRPKIHTKQYKNEPAYMTNLEAYFAPPHNKPRQPKFLLSHTSTKEQVAPAKPATPVRVPVIVKQTPQSATKPVTKVTAKPASQENSQEEEKEIEVYREVKETYIEFEEDK